MFFFVVLSFDADVDVVFADVSLHHVKSVSEEFFILIMPPDVLGRTYPSIYSFHLRPSTIQERSTMTSSGPSNAPYSPSSPPYNPSNAPDIPSNGTFNPNTALSFNQLVERLRNQHTQLPGIVNKFKTVADDHLRFLCWGEGLFTKSELEEWLGFYERVANFLTEKAQEVELGKAKKQEEGE